MPDWTWLGLTIYVIDLAIKVVAIGTIPRNRRPSSSLGWLLLIVFTPVLGVVVFLLIGSPVVRGRRERVQKRADEVIAEHTAALPELPGSTELPFGVASLVHLNERIGSLPMMTGVSHGLIGDYRASIDAMTAAVEAARERVHVEMYAMAWDDTTGAFFTALVDAVGRGVKVRLMYDHIGSRKYPGFKELNRRMTAAGIEWHQMMPIKPLQGRWRRPDLRNHRKLLVVDGEVAFMGSQNMIDSSYLMPKNLKAGRHWVDLNIKLSGQIVSALDAVFAMDWYAETHESLLAELRLPQDYPPSPQAFQLLPSGPGYPAIPNLRLFTALMHRAQRRLSLTSPYFVPDESLLEAITTAAYRGVEVELFVSEQADQFMVQYAQASYYEELLSAGVRIYLYPAPTVLHAKFFTVDDAVGVIGSSNMDYRSFGLDYEISLMGTDPAYVAELRQVADGYRTLSRELTADDWGKRSFVTRYVENVARLTSALQ